MRIGMDFVLRSGCMVGILMNISTSYAANEPEKWRKILPTVKVVSDCFASEAAKYPDISERMLRPDFPNFLQTLEPKCAQPIKTMIDEYNSIYAPLNGNDFYKGRYLRDLPRAVRVRIDGMAKIESSQPSPSNLDEKPKPEAPSADAAPLAKADRGKLFNEGDDCHIRDIYEKIAAAIPKKTDFETIKQYEVRADAALRASSVKLTGYKCNLNPSFRVKYNAEKAGYEYLYLYISETSEEIRGEKYEAQNAFGAKATITPVKKTEYRTKTSDGPFDKPIFAKIDAKVAEQQDSDLVFAVEFDIVNPFIREEYRRSQPTITYPYDETTTERLIIVREKRFYLYNKSTKNVLWSANTYSCDYLPGMKRMYIVPCPSSPY